MPSTPLARQHRRAFLSWLPCVALLWACERTDEASAVRALAQARDLVDVAKKDASEVRNGLPLGAKEIAKRWVANGTDLSVDSEAARDALNYARNKVQDLRVAKSTFFALATKEGRVIRNDREQDLMAGADLFAPFPALARAVREPYVEAMGVMPEAHGVKGKPDGEWVAASAVDVGQEVRALYVTGWAWSSYAFRLEYSLRNRVKTEAASKRENVPLLYTFVIVGDAVYGSPESPEVNAQAIADKKPLSKLGADGGFSTLFEITGRNFALGVQSAPDLAPSVAIAVLRSET